MAQHQVDHHLEAMLTALLHMVILEDHHQATLMQEALVDMLMLEVLQVELEDQQVLEEQQELEDQEEVHLVMEFPHHLHLRPILM